MLKNLVQLLHSELDKEVKLLCDPDTDIKIVMNALYKFMGYCEQIKQADEKEKAEAKAKADAEAAAKPTCEVPVVDAIIEPKSE